MAKNTNKNYAWEAKNFFYKGDLYLSFLIASVYLSSMVKVANLAVRQIYNIL